MTVNALVKELKENDENWEWYPTTFEQVESIARWIAHNGNDTQSILDIGCGNGGFFEKLDRTDYFHKDEYGHKNYNSRLCTNYKKYGIEKSNILAEQLPDDVILLGSDFNTNTLIDKKVDCIFCNPPYSEYEEWAERIIKEGNAEKIVLVIPQRWKNSERIKYALEQRKYTAEVIGSFDYLNAERKARAVVDLVGIMPNQTECAGHRYSEKQTDPFDLWFDTTFKLNAEKQQHEYDTQKKKKDEIIARGDTVDNLIAFYNSDMQKLYENYRALEKLDAEIFMELKVDIKMLKESLKARLKGLKNLYWDMLFKKYDKITQRLTSAGRDKVIHRLNDNTAIDFTKENIFQLTLWLIRHSNTLFDEQITDFFFKLVKSENIHRYKSNLRWNDSDWKYIRESCYEYGTFRTDKAKKLLKNFMLDYRIIVSDYTNFDITWSRPRMSESCRTFLYDMTVIGANLGFDADFKIPERYDEIDLDDWSNFDIMTKDGKLFCNVKLYKNGNRHLKFNTEFMRKLNVEAARINGWLHDKKQAEEEFGLTEKEISEVWNTNMKIGIGEGTKLLGLPA